MAHYFFDPPEILDCSVTAIPGSGSAPLEVIASLPRSAFKILVNDGVGQYIGVYTGSVGNEDLVCVIPSEEEIPILFFKGDRISVRSMSTSSITSGTLCISFVSG